MSIRITTFNTARHLRNTLTLALGFFSITPGYSDDTFEEEESEPHRILPVESAKFYRSPEERREAGLGTPLTEWLTFYGLLEVEYEHGKTKYSDQSFFSEETDTQAIQIGLETEFTDWLTGEFVLDVEQDRKLRTLLDEGVLDFDFETWAIKFGVQNLDFGEYYSHFVSGPMLEFGETRKWALALERELSDSIDFVAYTFDNEDTRATIDLGWGAALEWVSEDEGIRIGTGYLSDLRQSDDLFREEDYANPSDVPGWNLFALIGFESFEITAEAVTAIDYFTNEESRLRPQAYNLELAYFVNYDFQFASRIEYSEDLLEEPEWQTGVAITWLLGKHLVLSVDYLYGTFKTPFEIDDDETFAKYRNLIAAQIGFEF